jgi:hypothetical protein
MTDDEWATIVTRRKYSTQEQHARRVSAAVVLEAATSHAIYDGMAPGVALDKPG